ncbi:PEP-CTERM system TPR-repeat protein PrsT [Azoarcus sp. L1K30]|uniref:XrtA/PEP-CTERM system TPR-repeat protein PrsT n=1 Tax=Azoarcus sp. L1K30 TaxID=2820277 RepID=UPI001B82228B|nr:XrtA/PEP-CTERM system TPR-repeat protein PrsT [Azoarcus sp. L1K30]MBR0568050.1 PEP-CTERM system TPR-repeat protein PrsT [Azoarcus sp. L1K30]
MRFRISRALGYAALLLSTFAAPVHADTVAASRYYEDGLSRFGKQDVQGAIIQLKNALQQDRSMLAAHLLLAKAYLVDGDVGPAEVEFREALKLGVNRAEVAVPLGRIYLMQGRSQVLLDSVAAEGLPAATRLEVLVLRGKAYAALGKLPEASSSFAEARAIDPGSVIPLVAEVPVLLANGKGEDASKVAARAVELAPADAEALNARASVAHATGLLANALKDYERAIELQPKFLDARVARAGILIDIGRDADAARDLEEVVRFAPTEPRVAYLRALLAGRRGDAQAAGVLLEDAARLVDALPAEWVAGQEQLLMVGALAHHAGRQYEKARKYLDVLVTRYPRNPGARKLLAAVYIDTADYPRATDLLENVLRLQPDDPQALYLLGRAYLGLKRYAKATALLEKAVSLGGADPGLRATLGFSQLGQNDTVAAIGNLQGAFDKTPDDFSLALALANLHMQHGETKKALDVAQRASEAMPSNPAVQNLLGVVKGATKDLAGARRAYQAALKIDPGFNSARLNLARVDIAEGRLAEARKTYADMLRTNKRDAIAMYEFAILEQGAGRKDEALRWIEKAAAEQPSDVKIGLALIEMRAVAGDKLAARDAARALSSRRSGDLTVLEALARAELDVGAIKPAQQVLKDMTRLAEFDAAALVRIGYLQIAASDFSAAAYSAQKALQGRPDDADAMVLAVEVALAAKDLSQADKWLGQLRARHPANVKGAKLAGDIAMARKDFKAAAAAYRSAFALTPTSELVLRQAAVFAIQGEPAGAVPLLSQWLKAHPEDDVARRGLADFLAQARDWAAAKREYTKLLDRKAGDESLYNNLANVLIMLGDPAAVTMAERSVASAPGDGNARDTLGWALAQQGRLEEALPHLREARLRIPGSVEVKWHLGYVLARLERRAEARQELEAALSQGQRFEGDVDARALLRNVSQ